MNGDSHGVRESAETAGRTSEENHTQKGRKLNHARAECRPPLRFFCILIDRKSSPWYDDNVSRKYIV